MNPRIIVDKSLLQSLSSKASSPLDRHFDLVIPPILIKEIVGDLAVVRKSGERQIDMQTVVSKLADRFGINSVVCRDYWEILIHGLIGYPTEMDGRVPTAGLIPVETPEGKLGHKILATEDDNDLARWQKKQFSAEDAVRAFGWQSIKQSINRKFYLEKLRAWGIEFDEPSCFDQAAKLADRLFSDSTIQGRMLGLIYREFKVPLALNKEINLRWERLNRPLIVDFAPYPSFCLRANILLALGKMQSKGDGHDLRDLEYCYYLPFCEIFASNDKLHRELIPILARPNQSFVGNDLKEDLQRLALRWLSLTESEKVENHRTFGFRPPPSDSSIVYRLWEKHRPSYNPNDVIVPVPDGELHRQIQDLWKRVQGSESGTHSFDEGSFLTHSRSVSKQKIKELYPDVNIDELE